MNYNISVKKRGKHMIKEINSVYFIYDGKVEVDEINKNKIKDYWHKLQKETDLLHEGKILIVSNFINNQSDYKIELKEISFSHYMYAKENKTEDFRVMFSGTYILTSDEYVVCVLNNYYENELNFETLNLVGGMADAEDIVRGEYSSEKCLKREFKEELGFELEDENYDIKLKYLKYPSENENPVRYPIGTIYEIRTIYTKEQIKKIFEKQSHDNEVKNLVFFSKENYKDIYNYEHRKQYIAELLEKIFER